MPNLRILPSSTLCKTRILILLYCLLYIDIASATDHYYCDCKEEASTACVAGLDTNDGLSTSSARQTFANAHQTFVTSSTFLSGDTIKFCRGGSFAITNGAWLNYNCLTENACKVEDYIPSWGNNLPEPILSRNTDGYGFDLSNRGNPRVDGGISFRNLDMRCINCSAEASWGYFMFNDVDNVVIDNVRLSDWAIGIHMAGSNAPALGYLGNGVNDNIKIINSKITNSYRQGILGGANSLLVENNLFSRNGGPSLLDHNIYISSGNGITVKNNELYQSALDAQGNCIGVSLAVHGHIDNMVIEGNYVHEDIGKAGQGCWGISVDTGYATIEAFRNIIIRGNRVVNVGNVGIGLNACQDCLIENNIVIHEQNFGQSSIMAPNRDRTTSGDFIDLPMERLSIRNNSVFVKSNVSGTAITLGGEGMGHLLVSNAIHYSGNATFNCLNANLSVGNYTAIGYNVCGFPNANASSQWETSSGTSPDPLTAWKTIFPTDVSSKLSVPGFADLTTSPYNLRATNESAAIVNSGHPTLSAGVDIFGQSRVSNPDAGAYESATLDTLPPSTLGM